MFSPYTQHKKQKGEHKMLKKYLLVAAIMLVAVGTGLAIGASFALQTVHEQLAAQKITFPDAATLEKENSALVPYANHKVDTGVEAKAFSEYIGGHLQKIAGGKTYSEVSAEWMNNTSDQKLASQRQTLFMGETLRGLLLSAWGWSLVGQIAMSIAYALWALAVALLVILIALLVPTKSKKHTPAKRTTSRAKKR